MKGIEGLVFDTTGVGYFKAGKGFTPEAAEFTGLLAKGRMATVKVTSLKEVTLPKIAACYELQIAGLG